MAFRYDFTESTAEPQDVKGGISRSSVVLPDAAWGKNIDNHDEYSPGLLTGKERCRN